MAEILNAVWITGANSGIGKELVKEFVNRNHLTIGSARRIELLKSLKGELNEHADKFNYFALDVSSKDEMQESYRHLSSTYNIVGLINNAGVTSFKKAEENTIDEIENIIKVNLLGSIYAIKTVLPEMINNGGGTIINILSAVTKKVFTSSSAYSASKGGLLAYSNVLREEVRDKNIRVINISPGATSTPIWPQSTLQKFENRMMNPKDIARFIADLYEYKGNMVAEDITLRPIKGDL